MSRGRLALAVALSAGVVGVGVVGVGVAGAGVAASHAARTGEAFSTAHATRDGGGRLFLAGQKGRLTEPSAVRAYQRRLARDLSAVRVAVERLETLAGTPTVAALLVPLNDEVLTPIDNLANEALLLGKLHPNPAMREAASRASAEIEARAADVRSSPALGAALDAIDASGEPPSTRDYLGRLRRSVRRAGAHLPAETRGRARALRQEIVELGERFEANISKDRRSIAIDRAALEALGLPGDFVEARRPGPDGTVQVTTPADNLVFMKHARSDDLRRQLYTKFYQRGDPENGAVLAQLLLRRHQLATLLGYESWAHYAGDDTMLKTPAAMRAFIESIAALSRAPMEREIAVLTDRLRQDNPAAGPIQDWQLAYYVEKLSSDGHVDSGRRREDFRYDQTLKGLLDLTTSLFGITFAKVDAPVWHPSVEVYEVSEDRAPIGRLYLDTQPRDGKQTRAETLPRQNGVKGRQTPEAVLIGNYPRRGPLDPKQVVGMFHEWGHVLQVILGGQQRWIDISGFNTDWDVTELPSKVFEELARHPEVLRRFATNARGEPIPGALGPRLAHAPLGEALGVRRQLGFADLALRLHGGDPRGMDIAAASREALSTYLPFPVLNGTRPELGFSQLYEYGPRYYAYVASAVFARDVFASLFETEGVASRQAGARFRREFLERGGSLSGGELLARTLGRPVSVEPFRRWLSPDGVSGGR